MRLKQRQARETGICPVRRELYSQCFGERLIMNNNDIYLPAQPNHLLITILYT